MHYLQIGAITWPEEAPGLRAELPRLAAGPWDQRVHVLTAAFATLFPLGLVN